MKDKPSLPPQPPQPPRPSQPLSADEQILFKAEAALHSLEANKKAIMEYHRVSAALLHHKYVALVEAGFTKEQALQLCKDGGLA